MKHFFTALVLFCAIQLWAQTPSRKVVVFKIQEEIAPTATRLVTKAFQEASAQKAELVIIEMDTYGGLLNEADSIRKVILNAKMPVYVYINKNAASAGALISIACDKIYMSPGATIGSASVVNGDGALAPDKYQSYMRSIMRSTAESHGKDTFINGNDTTFVYKRDPRIAEAMVDERISVPGIVDSGRVAAFTTLEAIKIGYCEGQMLSVDDILKKEDKTSFQRIQITKTILDKVIGFLSGPAIRGVLIMFIFWGIFFEIRSPGIGFPLLAATISALIYFAPLYLDGLAANWEILLFIVGMVLIALEVFVIPGFGVAGISGIILTITSLILSLIRNVDFDFSTTSEVEINRALTIVFVSMVGFIGGLLLFGKGMMNSPLSKKLVLNDTLKGVHVGMPSEGNTSFIGAKGIAHTDIRPMGKINIDGNLMDCKSMSSFISKGDPVQIVGKEQLVWIVEKTVA